MTDVCGQCGCEAPGHYGSCPTISDEVRASFAAALGPPAGYTPLAVPQPTREEQVAGAVMAAARQAYCPRGGEPSKREVIATCAALIEYAKLMGIRQMADEIGALRIQLGGS